MNRPIIIILCLFAAWSLIDKWQSRPLVHAPGILVREAPRQDAVPDSVFRFDDYILSRRARFSLRARVLSTERYWLGREADLSPVDLALGWGVMSDEEVLEQIDVTQRGRWYYTRWESALPISEGQVVGHSGNMHMIPSRPGVARRLKSLRPGDVIWLEGFLVDVDHPSGWRWRTSMSRDDSGAGACEIVYGENVSRETDQYLST